MTVEVEFTDDDLDAIMSGEVVEKQGEAFCHTNVWEAGYDAPYIFVDDTAERLRSGKDVKWSNAVGTYAGTVDNEPESVLEELQQVREEKNADYGNAYEKVGVLKRVMADEDGPQVHYVNGRHFHGSDIGDEVVEVVVLADTPQNESTFEENVDGVLTRLLDKVIRTYTLVFLSDEPAVENESTEDAAKDLTGYGSMLADLIRGAA